MKTERERAKALIEAIDSVEAIPRSLVVKLRELVDRWRPLLYTQVADKTRIGSGTHAALERLCNAAENYIKALEDAKALLEVR